ncbi:MAG: RHS repeat-associated core domain-containing protein [Myxococcota bacterium]
MDYDKDSGGDADAAVASWVPLSLLSRITDARGSVRAVVNASTGQVAQSIVYGVFGEVLSDSQPGFQPFGFAGGLYDHATGLVRFGARDYDPISKRWTAKDPLGFAAGDTSLYRYAMNDPVNLIDPGGEAVVTITILYVGFNGALLAVDIYNNVKDLLDPCLSAEGRVRVVTRIVADVLIGMALGKVSGSILKRVPKAAEWLRTAFRKGCFVAGTLVATSDGLAVPIEEVEVGDRVETERGGDTILTLEEPWYRAEFVLVDESDSEQVYDIEILRPEGWFEANEVFEPGDEAWLEFDEIGARGFARATGLSSFNLSPTTKEPGRLVLSTISNANNDVYEVSFVEGGEALRGTGAHPLYSLDRDDWVRVRDLQVGERLQTAEGAVTVEALEKVRGVHRVYNLEVEGDHEYLVGEAGVRAHNTCPDLPSLDATGKVHGALPDAKDLSRYSREELAGFRDDLQKSVQERIRKTVELGRDKAHGQRQGAEQELIRRIDKLFED